MGRRRAPGRQRPRLSGHPFPLHVFRAHVWVLHLGGAAPKGHAEDMQPAPHNGSDLDFSLVAMAIVMTLAIVFIVAQLA